LNIMETLDQILLDKVVYDSQIPELTLKSSPKFREYWAEFCQTTDDDFRLENVIDYVVEMGYNGEFGDNVWGD
jgi:hypothetical protein